MQSMVERRENATLVRLAAGHVVHADSPETFAKVVSDFLVGSTVSADKRRWQRRSPGASAREIPVAMPTCRFRSAFDENIAINHSLRRLLNPVRIAENFLILVPMEFP
jgi:hypothetical protein